MIRLFLALWLAIGGSFAPMPHARDANLAMAMAAGALCAAEPGSPVQDSPHTHCLACPAMSAAGVPTRGPALPMPDHRAVSPGMRLAEHTVLDGSWPAYASRAPPPAAG